MAQTCGVWADKLYGAERNYFFVLSWLLVKKMVSIAVCVCEAIYGNWSIACDSWDYLAQYQMHYKYSNSLDIFGFLFRIKGLENRCCLCLCNLLCIIPRKTYFAFYITTFIVYGVDNASWKHTIIKIQAEISNWTLYKENRNYLNFKINFVI